MSAAELSRRIGMSSSYVAKVEAGSIDPSVKTFAKMVTELDLTDLEIAWLIRLIVAQEEIAEGRTV